MRLNTPLSAIKGVGPKTYEALSAAGLHTVEDALNNLPRRYDDYSEVVKIADLKPGKVAVRARCESVETRPVRRGMRITTATLYDDSGKVKAVWFNQPYRDTQLKSDKWFLFSGQFGMQYNRYQITSPSVEQVEGEVQQASEKDKLVPVYRLSKGLKPKDMTKLMKQLQSITEFLPETLPEGTIKRNNLVSRSEAVASMHYPIDNQSVEIAKNRLAFEELFEMLLAAQYNKQENSKLKGWQIPFDLPVVKAFVAGLQFRLTNAQRRAAWQILQDFENPYPMNRLLQGDVGSGKTVVAGLVAAQVSKAGLQTAIMAPTEILATQHAQTLASLLEPLGINIALLTGSVKSKAREELLDKLSAGEVDVIVGTHALIQDKVNYNKLGLVVIDEQHRFGVKQRQALLAKSQFMPHLLSMTATPIPRSLALTLYGELEVSILDELPVGRQKIDTKIWSPISVKQLHENIDQELKKGRQGYVICSLIDDNPDNDRKSVETEYKKLQNGPFSGYKIGLLHGKMKSEEKDSIMSQFASGELDLLVSTTVVEVGVNVPNATVMLIENADMFGLSQLHQLRGRVGRGEYKSYCHLMMSGNEKPSARLKEIEKSQDGFYLAEIDLKLRGPGEIYGRAQHGVLNFQIASLADTKLIAQAQAEAKLFIKLGIDVLQYSHLARAVARYQRVTTLN